MDFFPGSYFGEYRIDEGLLINGRFDKMLSKSYIIGYRLGVLNLNNTSFTGHGIKIVKNYHGIILNISSSISGHAFSNGEWEKGIISGGITFVLI